MGLAVRRVGAKIAVKYCVCPFLVNVHAPMLPVQTPNHPKKVYKGWGVAVSVTDPGGKSELHATPPVLSQLVMPGVPVVTELTVPPPATLTFRGLIDAAAKVAVTAIAVLIVT